MHHYACIHTYIEGICSSHIHTYIHTHLLLNVFINHLLCNVIVILAGNLMLNSEERSLTHTHTHPSPY